MTTGPTSFLSEVLSGEVIPAGKRAYFQERLRNRLYALVLGEFAKRQAAGVTKAGVAARIQKRPEQVNRWLASPGNWTLDTVSDLLLAVSAAELDFSVSPLSETPRNRTTPNWLNLSVSQPDRSSITLDMNMNRNVSNIPITDTRSRREKLGTFEPRWHLISVAFPANSEVTP